MIATDLAFAAMPFVVAVIAAVWVLAAVGFVGVVILECRRPLAPPPPFDPDAELAQLLRERAREGTA